MKKRYTFSSKNWLRVGLLSAFAASLTFNLQAQTAPAKIWDKTFGGSGSDHCRSLQQTSDGGFILGGSSNSGATGDKSQPNKGLNDFWVIKLSASGSKIWDKTFGGSGEDHLFEIKQTTDGGYILGGRSDSGVSGDKSQPSKGSEDFWVLKLDANGSKIWDKSFGGSSTDELYALQQTADGGYVLGGISSSGIGGDKSQASQGNIDYWVVKLDANGNKTWDKTFGGSDFDGLYSLRQTSDGGYIFGGGSFSNISGDKSQASIGSNDYWVVKINANGSKLWDKTFGTNDFEYYSDLQQTSDGGYILAGASAAGISGDKSQPSKGDNDYWVIKLDATGNKIWDKTIGGSAYEEITSIQQTSDGGFILGGFSDSGIGGDKTEASKGFSDFWVVKLDSNGNKTWDKSLGGSLSDLAPSLQQTSDGGFILGGFSHSGISGDKTQPSQGGSDFWVIKLGGNLTGFSEAETSILLSVFPNPGKGKFQLQLNELSTPTVGIIITDLLGRVVMQQELKVTNGQVASQFDLQAANGIYLLQIIAGKQSISRKIIVE